MNALPVWRRLRLRDNPFASDFHPSRLYLGEARGRVERTLRSAIDERHPLIVLTGEPGSGRTSLLLRVIDDPQRADRTLRIAAASVTDFLGVLRALLTKLEPAASALVPNSHLGSRLSTVLHRQPEKGVVLAFDDADRIDLGVLEDAIRLSGVINAKKPLFTLVLVGEPRFSTMVKSLRAMMLHAPALTMIELGPLSPNDVASYIAHYLAEAGYQGALPFSGEATLRIAEAADGLPLDVNRLCATALDSLAPVRLPIDYSFVAAAIMAQRGTIVAPAAEATETVEVAGGAAMAKPPLPEQSKPAVAADAEAIKRLDHIAEQITVAMRSAEKTFAHTAHEQPDRPSDRETADSVPLRSESLTFTVDSPSYGVLPTQLVPTIGGFGAGIHLASPSPNVAPPRSRRSTARRRRLIVLACILGAGAGGAAVWATQHGIGGGIVNRLQAMLGNTAAPVIVPVTAPPPPVSAPPPLSVPAPVNAPASAPSEAPPPARQVPALTMPTEPAAVAGEPSHPAPEPPALVPVPISAAPSVPAVTATPPVAAEPPAEASAPPAQATATAAPSPAIPAAAVAEPPAETPAAAVTVIAGPVAPQPTAEPAPEPPMAAPHAVGTAAPPVNRIETAALIARGEDFLEQADIASAQLFFRLAADHGSAAAARAIATTVDPIALTKTPIPGGRADAAEAIFWYRRAIALGDAEAEAALARLVELLRRRAEGGDPAAVDALKTLQ